MTVVSPFLEGRNALHRQWHKVNPKVVRSLERSRPAKNNHLSALELLISAFRRPSLATATRPFEVCSPRYLATLPGWSAIGSDESGCSRVLSHEGTKYTNTGTKWDVVATAEQPVPRRIQNLPGWSPWLSPMDAAAWQLLLSGQGLLVVARGQSPTDKRLDILEHSCNLPQQPYHCHGSLSNLQWSLQPRQRAQSET